MRQDHSDAAATAGTANARSLSCLLHLAAMGTRSIGPAPDDRQLRCALRRPLVRPLHRLRALDQSGRMVRLLLDWRLAGWTTARAVARVDSKPILHRKEAR